MEPNKNTDDTLDFDVLIVPHGSGGYTARLLSSPAGVANAHFTLPFSDLEIENFVLRMGQVRTGLRQREAPQTQAAREFGQRLFDAVFGKNLEACWQSSAAEAAQQGKRLRLRLRLGDAPELLDLPWEYLYDSGSNRFITLSSNTPLVRYLELPGRVEPLPVRGPLRILALIASPHDFAALDVEREWDNLQRALADLSAQQRVQIDRCPRPTLPELQRALRRQDYHIFHFIGHGGYDSQGGGVLLFEDEQQRSRVVTGHQLGSLLRDEGHLRLAVLNACEGARASRSDPFAGVGQSLLKQGVPAVIAMQFAITDVAASAFAHEFYAALADSYPIDRSLAEARKAMFAQSNGVEWGTPVLYMRPAEGHIFNVIAPAQGAARPVPVQAPVQAPAPAPVQTPVPAPAVRAAPQAVSHVQPQSRSPAPAHKSKNGCGIGCGAMGLLTALVLAITAFGIIFAVRDSLSSVNLTPTPELGLQNAAVYIDRGSEYIGKQAFDSAIVELDKAIALEPQNAVAYFGRGTAYMRKDAYSEAIADFRKAVELNPEFAEAHNSLCWSLGLLQQAQHAIAYCEEAVSLTNHPEHIDSRGLVYALLGDMPAAMTDFQVYVDWLENKHPDKTNWIEQRRSWIQSLQRGENPITPEVLAELRYQ